MTEITWTTTELIGQEVYLNKEDLKAHRPLTREPVKGERLLVYMIGGWGWADVIDPSTAETEHYWFPLERCSVRECWVSAAVINKAACEKLKEALNARAKPKPPSGA